ncbi:MAG: hypothetical protein JAY66_24235 [Candidatus Thiodiazotropha taylori]|nr:hypothetical protein [Candidatus Thiodiazotropha taylori]
MAARRPHAEPTPTAYQHRQPAQKAKARPGKPPRVGPSMLTNPAGFIGRQGLRRHPISMPGKSPTKIGSDVPKMT